MCSLSLCLTGVRHHSMRYVFIDSVPHRCDITLCVMCSLSLCLTGVRHHSMRYVFIESVPHRCATSPMRYVFIESMPHRCADITYIRYVFIESMPHRNSPSLNFGRVPLPSRCLELGQRVPSIFLSISRSSSVKESSL
ncbi:hypothetical protein CEXT_509031 [Caerostris extrusa]|uniref:Uncharacterized protein n=1 Tax=Caerostris extrusa TaxID=172846 RepID=A0AAV4X5M6_CAEEX|nr:hypothetical protein CEXT_509031 [Caerostris extrusa]